MGTVIYYCEQCGRRVQEQELADGGAQLLDEQRVLCSQCAARPAPSKPHRGDTQARLAPPPHAAPRPAPVASARQRGPASEGGTSRVLIVSIGVGLLVILVPALFFLLAGSGSTRPAKKSGTSQAKTASSTAPAPAPPIRKTEPAAAPAPAATPEPPAPAPVSAPTPAVSMTNFRDELAAGEWVRLKAQTFPDEMTRHQALSRFVSTYTGTPAAREAAQARDELKIPADLAEITNWHDLWTPGPTLNCHWVWHENFGGKPFVCESHPLTADLPERITRRMKVPEDRPFLEVEVRGHERGDRELWLEADGEAMPHVTSVGNAPHVLALDLSARKGREVEIALGHASIGAWDSEHAFWQFPHFVKQPSNAARVYVPTGAAAAPPAPILVLPEKAAWDKAVNLLTPIQVGEDTVRGSCRMDGGKLLCEGPAEAQLALPYEPPQEYDFRVRFTRLDGNDAVVQTLRLNGHDAAWVLCGWKGQCSGFERSEDRRADNNPSTLRREGLVENGRECICIVRVRRLALYAFLDGKPITVLTTDGNNLSAEPAWSPAGGKENRLGVATFASRVVFHAIDVLEVTGQGRLVR